MSRKFIFNSSMPRAGSTLLQNILAQNPQFYCSPTSGLFEMLLSSRTVFTKSPSFKAQDSAQMKAAFLGACRGAMTGFYDALTDRPVCIDKNRGWLQYYHFVEQFWPDPKMIVCVRDLRAVLSSMEKLFRKNQHLEEWSEKPGNIVQLVTIENRVRHWLNTIPVGIQTLRLNDVIQTGVAKRLHFVRFEDLTAKPEAEMRKIYQYIDEPYFEHQFDRVEQVTQEDDAYYPTYGDHTIREQVKPVAADFEEVLGREICALVKQENPTFFRTFYPDAR